MTPLQRVGWALSCLLLNALAGTALAAPPELAATGSANRLTTVPAGPPIAPAAGSPARLAAAPTTAASAVPPRTALPAVGTKRGRSQSVDSVELERTTITGNRELPNVMVIVPWKPADPGDLLGGPGRSLVDEALAPLDREEFRREVRYHEALLPAPAATTAPGRP